MGGLCLIMKFRQEGLKKPAKQASFLCGKPDFQARIDSNNKKYGTIALLSANIERFSGNVYGYFCRILEGPAMQRF